MSHKHTKLRKNPANLVKAEEGAPAAAATVRDVATVRQEYTNQCAVVGDLKTRMDTILPRSLMDAQDKAANLFNELYLLENGIK